MQPTKIRFSAATRAVYIDFGRSFRLHERTEDAFRIFTESDPEGRDSVVLSIVVTAVFKELHDPSNTIVRVLNRYKLAVIHSPVVSNDIEQIVLDALRSAGYEVVVVDAYEPGLPSIVVVPALAAADTTD